MRILITLLLLIAAPFARAQSSYVPGDWTSYRDFRFARSLDAGTHTLFVATTGGILEYHLYKHRWYDPFVVGYGASKAIALDDPILLNFDEAQQKLWVATPTELLQYDLGMEQWRITDRNKWPQDSRVVNIGISDQALYVETLPAFYYARFFGINAPLPEPEWRDVITRYRGSRQFGGLMLDLDPLEPAGVRWRGLRSKLPLNSSEMYGALGMPPANFPPLVPPDNYVWQNDGTLLDPALRAAPITDWILDEQGNLWTTHWGAGVLQSDLHTFRGALYQAGPAGNNIRSILVRPDGFYLGGLNSGDRMGICAVDGDLLTWQRYEARDDARIRSTDVYDMADWQGRIWLATQDGLLSFNEQKREWERFDVQKNLFSNDVRALSAVDSELWIGTARGLVVMTPGREIWRINSPGLELSEITDLAVLGDTVYVGTAQGLFKGHRTNRSFTFGGLDPGLLNAPINEIATTAGEVWIATPDGIMRSEPATGTSKSWLAADWFGNSEPTCIQADARYVWVGTNGNGFYRYRKETGEWLNYTTADGLVNNHVQTIRIDGNDLLIGTQDGLTRYWWNRPGQLR